MLLGGHLPDSCHGKVAEQALLRGSRELQICATISTQANGHQEHRESEEPVT